MGQPRLEFPHQRTKRNSIPMDAIPLAASPGWCCTLPKCYMHLVAAGASCCTPLLFARLYTWSIECFLSSVLSFLAFSIPNYRVHSFTRAFVSRTQYSITKS